MSERERTNWRERIRAFLAADPAREVTEDGEFLFDLRCAEFRLEENRGKLLLHLWSLERTWVRRILGIAQESPDRLVLQVERYGRAKPGRLVVASARARRTAAEQERTTARRVYVRWLRRLLAREFPRARLEGLTAAPDLKRSFSALYARARLRQGERWWAVMGVNAGESAAAVDVLLTYALIWFDWNRRRYPERVWAGLRLFLPEGRSRTTANRLLYLVVPAELYATNEEEFACARVDPRDFGNLDTYLVPARQTEEIRAAESSALDRIRLLAPEEIEEVVNLGRPQLSLWFRGLEFARSAAGQVSFGVGGKEKPLTAKNFREVEALLERLRRERTPEGSPVSSYYRMQPERWLESQVRAAPQAVDPRLAPERLYRQVPTVSAGERGVADLLGATRNGNLVVIELKVSADPHLPLQALDYWMRVRWHQERGQLPASGYFPGLHLKPDPPELLLVAPALQFHPTAEALTGYLKPEVRVTRVGLSEDWRRELKVIFRRGPG